MYISRANSREVTGVVLNINNFCTNPLMTTLKNQEEEKSKLAGSLLELVRPAWTSYCDQSDRSDQRKSHQEQKVLLKAIKTSNSIRKVHIF